MKTVETGSKKIVALVPESDIDIFELGKLAERVKEYALKSGDRILTTDEHKPKITAMIISKDILIKESLIKKFGL